METLTKTITVTAKAAEKVKEFMKQEGRETKADLMIGTDLLVGKTVQITSQFIQKQLLTRTQ